MGKLKKEILYCPVHGEVIHYSYSKNKKVCTKCNQQGVTELRRRVKLTLIEAFGGACQCCGENSHPSIFEFHHIDPKTKEFKLSSAAVNKSITKAYAEAKKCIMVCSNCHKLIHAEVVGKDKVLKAYIYNLENLPSKIDLKKKKEVFKVYNKCSKCGADITRHSTTGLCTTCYKLSIRKVKDRPSVKQLKKDVEELGYKGTGRKYGVSDNTIRKWIK